ATGRYLGENCNGAEKVRRYREIYGDTPIEGFWSDSRGDSPMAAIAERAYLVKGQELRPW
ncbi:MAG: polysaccharide biosynthesis protein GtrA, partial [Oscillospiraceae bacterium]|nr:polysaccharide biosynthesis protein GtrA [Oscillospiraceae bacterium]